MGEAILDEAYQRLHRTGPEYEGGLSDHGPMAVEALVRHGHDRTVHRWLDAYLGRPRRTHAHPAAVGGERRRGLVRDGGRDLGVRPDAAGRATAGGHRRPGAGLRAAGAARRCARGEAGRRGAGRAHGERRRAGAPSPDMPVS
ncbi:hypothetical protein KBX06_13595 [Micromonospora sp. C31]|uniref:hypothetical protein n=1 Tax=Micromonospora sp. C31 TaxID=2824876 RepID=UPI001B36503F|nr:hypothetical protein [Micromonospora sp. C31]MBQ1074185.1 hypothetical protein [Micromonospora sp. C31]